MYLVKYIYKSYSQRVKYVLKYVVTKYIFRYILRYEFVSFCWIASQKYLQSLRNILEKRFVSQMLFSTPAFTGISESFECLKLQQHYLHKQAPGYQITTIC